MILEVQHINHTFGQRQVLHDVNFGIDSGEIVGVLGDNGAGKTTLLRIITRLIEPTSGYVLFDGLPIAHKDMARIGYLPEERGLYRRMRVEEQALYFAQLKGMGRTEAYKAITLWFDRLGMTEWAHRRTNTLSKGMQQRLQFAVSVLHSPSLLILDEPFSGFDATNASMLQHEVARLRDQGTAILLSTHNHQAADTLCTRIVQL